MIARTLAVGLLIVGGSLAFCLWRRRQDYRRINLMEWRAGMCTLPAVQNNPCTRRARSPVRAQRVAGIIARRDRLDGKL